MNRYNWRPAAIHDLQDIVALAQTHFEIEIDNIFTPEPMTYARNLTLAIVNQHYNPFKELISVARDNEDRLLAYTWAGRGETAPWSDDEIATIRMAHVAQSLSPRLKVELVKDMLGLWETWARISGLKVISSTTMRSKQDAFLRLHEQAGFTVRGSFAYKRLSTT